MKRKRVMRQKRMMTERLVKIKKRKRNMKIVSTETMKKRGSADGETYI